MGIRPLIVLITTVLAGLILDRIRRLHYVLAVTCLLQVVGCVLLAFLKNSYLAFLYALVAGISGGLLIICTGVLTPNLFGRRYIGGILGVSVAVSVIGSAIGPVLFGAAFDWIKGYKEIIVLSSLLPFLSGTLCVFIRKPVLKGNST